MKTSLAIRFVLLILLITCSSGCNKGHLTPFLQAARSGDTGKVEQYLSKGTDVNEVSPYGWTALMFAAWKGHEDVVVRLLDAGADPNLVSKRIARSTQAPTPETTALAQAIKNNHFSIARILLARGAAVDSASVALAGGLKDLPLLKEIHAAAAANLNRKSLDRGFSSAIATACKSGSLENLKWLIENGAVPSFEALIVAVRNDRLEMLQHLIGQGGDGNGFSEKDISAALLWAATKDTGTAHQDQNLEIIKLLLAHGADRNYRPAEGHWRNLTASEFLGEARAASLKRIELDPNPYSDVQIAFEKQLIKHRDAILLLLEK